jgi:BirA family biotin operon repressor/biotin-[acetyl-CoA-carboxylase] ligase
MTKLKLPSRIREISLGEVDSTNTQAKKLATNGAESWTLVWAKRQSAGRGRYSRQWVSPEGNVFWSLIIRPLPDWPDIGHLVYVAGIAVADVVGTLLPPGRKVSLKWPNDALVEGRKISGALLESGGIRLVSGETGPRRICDWIVVGIGINVVAHPTDQVLYPATSLSFEGSPAQRDEVIERLTSAFVERVDQWATGGFNVLRPIYDALAHNRDKEIVVKLSDVPGEHITGIYRGIDQLGMLILETPAGTQKIAAGDVFFRG